MLTITLNCLVVGKNPYKNAFSIMTNLIKAIRNSNKTIKEKKASEFDNFAADKLKLWKVDISLEENGELIAANTKINTNIKDELGGIELTSLSKIIKDIHCIGGKATTTTIPLTRLNVSSLRLNMFEGVKVLYETLETLRDDSELGNLARRILGRDAFFKKRLSDEKDYEELKHKLKNTLFTENDEKMLLEIFGEENKKKLLEQGNLKLAKSIPSDILDKQLRNILWATELIKWVTLSLSYHSKQQLILNKLCDLTGCMDLL
ncbi:14627_t:CDS:2 [Funneliformis geosporum]|uniref:14627_t:CDS:1 n=1 Tax=Funneliformis geosporum TaxID=1117311 RepID=A0A9W4SQ42_9GLOM|nr:14627_t:CDS:2 [Funneliformis geosporum]